MKSHQHPYNGIKLSRFGSVSEGKGDSGLICMLWTCWGNKSLSYTLIPLFFFFFLPEKPNYFIKELSDLKIEESGTAVFICQSEKAASSVIWRKGIAELRPGRKYEMTQKGQDLQLTIKNLEKSDSDTYTCDIGDAQSRAKLVVQGMCESHKTVHPVSPLPRRYLGRICTFMAYLWGCSCLA